MERWRETTLGEVCDEVNGLIQTGPFGSQLHQSDYSEAGTPVVMPKDIVEGRIAPDTVARISTEHVKRLSRHKLLNGDIVYGRRGDIGRQALITQGEAGWMCGTGCIRISLGDSVLWPQFLHYYLRQEDVVSWITNQAVGATMPNLNTEILRSVPVRFPSLPIQRRIAGILSTYDELIENSQRRIKTLEAMARALYREALDTGRESTASRPIVDSPYWRFISENVSPYRGTKRYFATADIDGLAVTGPGIDYSFAERPSRAQKQPIHNSVWFARMKESYKIAWYGPLNDERVSGVILSSGFAGFEARDAELWPLLFLTISSREFHSQKDLYCTGATQMSLTNEGLARIMMPLPNEKSARRLGRTVGPMLNAIAGLQQRNENLLRTRDLLLPRLLSGQIDVKAMSA